MNSSAPTHMLNLPSRRNPYFTGREEVLEQLHRSLHQHHTSALVQAITGLGGIGKTQTAVEYAHRYQGEYNTILWVTADTPETLLADYTLLAHLLALPEQNEQEQSLVIQAVVRWMETHEHWLLVLDNVEDLDVVRSFLPERGGEYLILTTRSQVVGEFAAPVLVEAMDTETGALLLLRRAKLLAPSLTLHTPSLFPKLREEALTLALELGGLNNLAGFYKGQGKYAEAEPLLQRALSIWKNQLGEEYPDTALGLEGIAEVYTHQSKYAQAETLYRQALVIREQQMGEEHPTTAVSLVNLANLYDQQDLYAKAEPLLRRALSIRERSLGPDHPDTRLLRDSHVDLLQKLGRTQEVSAPDTE